ncbi:MAG: MBL fold metallo-hydrolase [Euryarchaeota archaeon]|nr:MBL fold metallo-hydrolase [Euryarchaeota archaeon]
MYEIMFLGGAKEVGRVGMLMFKEGSPIALFDYGMKPSNPPEYPIESPPVNSVFITHAHLDHSGLAPWLAARYAPSIYATPVTHEVGELLHRDAIKVASIEGYPIPYSNEEVDIYRSISMAYLNFGEDVELGEERVEVIPAGHIPGASMFRIITEHGIALFTGDLNTKDTHLVEGAKSTSADVVIIEGTYSGREHPDRREVEKMFLDAIEERVSKGGTVLVPAFAVGRSQEVLMILTKRGGYDVWYDGMGKQVSEIYLSHPSYLRDSKALRKALKEVNIVQLSSHRNKALKDGNVIVATSGMLEGGPALYYISKLKDDPKNAVYFTGYQVEGTNGRYLLDTGHINLQGVSMPVVADVKFFDFSAHAGHSELIDFIKKVNPERVIIFHSDNPEPLADDLRDIVSDVIIPDITLRIPLFP